SLERKLGAESCHDRVQCRPKPAGALPARRARRAAARGGRPSPSASRAYLRRTVERYRTILRPSCTRLALPGGGGCPARGRDEAKGWHDAAARLAWIEDCATPTRGAGSSAG